MDDDGDYVLYWMIANRRPTYNFALERAVEVAVELGRPLVILEALRHGYRWACDRFHGFILDGMADNRRAFPDRAVTYYPFVETPEHPGSGLLERLAADACAVVTDDFPCFFLPRMLDAVADRLDVALEAVDANGLLPMRGTDKMYKRAYDYRRYLHRTLLDGLPDKPAADPLADTDLPEPHQLSDEIATQWPPADDTWFDADDRPLDNLPIDHTIEPHSDLVGGPEAARSRLDEFIADSVDDYHERRNDLTDEASSGLSPYLHFGHIATQRIFEAIVDDEDWSIRNLDDDRIGKREEFWGLDPGPEAYLDQLLTWRELGFNRCALDPDGYDDYDTLPEWARQTLEDHACDPRPHVYSLEEFERGRTHDELWNAAQHQLVTTGTMHNYLRMLWGKKILHWTESPRRALEVMIELNNKYATDGRDPNSYNGIFWVLGRFDRPWGPERDIFGKIRYMTTKSTRRKFDVDNYLERFRCED